MHFILFYFTITKASADYSHKQHKPLVDFSIFLLRARVQKKKTDRAVI